MPLFARTGSHNAPMKELDVLHGFMRTLDWTVNLMSVVTLASMIYFACVAEVEYVFVIMAWWIVSMVMFLLINSNLRDREFKLLLKETFNIMGADVSKATVKHYNVHRDGTMQELHQ